MNYVSLVTTTSAPPTTTTTISADISTVDCLNETPSFSPGNHQATPTNNNQSGDSNEHRTTPSQVDAASEGTDSEVNVDTSGDSLLLGELMVGEEMIEGGGGREEGGGVSGEGGKDGGEEKARERRKPPVTKRYV